MSEVQDRERIVGEHVRLYGLTTAAALKRLVFPDMTEKAIARLTERLVETQWLVRKRLPGGGRYFKIGKRAASELRLRLRPSRNSGYQSLVARLGVLYFCAKLGIRIYSPAEFRQRFPELSKPGFTASNYYVDKGDVNRLGFIHVDHGRTAERLATKIRARLATRYRDEDFAALIQQGRFLIAIVTPTEEKSRAVRAELEKDGPSPVRFRVETVEELFPVLVESPPKGRRADDV